MFVSRTQYEFICVDLWLWKDELAFKMIRVVVDTHLMSGTSLIPQLHAHICGPFGYVRSREVHPNNDGDKIYLVCAWMRLRGRHIWANFYRLTWLLVISSRITRPLYFRRLYQCPQQRAAWARYSAAKVNERATGMSEHSWVIQYWISIQRCNHKVPSKSNHEEREWKEAVVHLISRLNPFQILISATKLCTPAMAASSSFLGVP